jgi:hypothetical protein
MRFNNAGRKKELRRDTLPEKVKEAERSCVSREPGLNSHDTTKTIPRMIVATYKRIR